MHSLYYTIYALSMYIVPAVLPRSEAIFLRSKRRKNRFIIVIFNKSPNLSSFYKNSIDKRKAKAYYVLKPKT